MLELRPNCELCDCDLPVDSTEARICSYECTFCADCVDKLLKNVCPNCAGGFVARPIRPTTERRTGVSRKHHPPSAKRRYSPYSQAEIGDFAEGIKDIPAEQR
jgi:hypothetical protein